MLLNICKIKKLLNSFNNCRALVGIFLIFFIIGGAWWGGNVIFMPCKFETFQFTSLQVSAEHETGVRMFDACGVNYVIGGSGFQLKPGQFVLEGGNKLFRCLLEVITPGNVYAEEVGGKTPDEYSRDSIQETGKRTVHIDFTSYDFFKGWLLGICFGLLVIYLFYFTQRRDNPRRHG